MTSKRIPAPPTHKRTVPVFSTRPTGETTFAGIPVPDRTPTYDRMATDPVDMGVRTRRSGRLTEHGKRAAANVRRQRQMAETAWGRA